MVFVACDSPGSHRRCDAGLVVEVERCLAEESARLRVVTHSSVLVPVEVEGYFVQVMVMVGHTVQKESSHPIRARRPRAKSSF